MDLGALRDRLGPDPLDLGGDPAGRRVVVAMSGGVDSSAVCAIAAAAGYDVVGVTLQLYDQGAPKPGQSRTCCAGVDIRDARAVADGLGVPHYVLDYESRFRDEVIEDFADSYARGETPIPCVRCNQTVKFRDLLAVARDLGAEALATGHYLRRVTGPDGVEMRRAADPARDQSYFLFATTRDQLNFLRFPLGGMATKAETRAIAEAAGLRVAEKPDSQDICFVPTGSYAALVEKLRPGAAEPGAIRHIDGAVLGRHDGVIRYTIGQRKGLGIGGRSDADDPLYVVALQPETREVIVGPKGALARDRVILRAVNWLGAQPPDPAGLRVAVKLRSAQAPLPAILEQDAEGARVILDEPEYGVAPGQACVFYAGDRVLGGGWIVRAENSAFQVQAA